jgi:integral membrane protein (TIGR01906 family)
VAPESLHPNLKLVLRGVAQVAMVVLLVLGTVHLILATAKLWISIEYRLPGFPDDAYGFTLEDRLYWSSIDLDFLFSDEGTEYFDEYVLDNGDPMHNDRELKHFVDVKNILSGTRVVFWIGLFGLGVVLTFVGWSQGSNAVWTIVRTGSFWTLAIIGILIFGLVFAFGVIFVGFHEILFDPNTWIFKYSDTFIRLYPERFWRDVFAFVLAMTLGEAGVLYFLAKRMLTR